MTTLIHRSQQEAPTEKEIKKHLKDSGLSTEAWSGEAGTAYPVHKHPYRRIIFCTRGSIQFKTFPDLKTYDVRTGDKLLIPANTEHTALVGSDGVVCIEAHDDQ